METISNIKPEKLNNILAGELKKIPEIIVPEWAHFVKTSCSKARPPVEPDFWYKRAASILRQISIKGVVGVGKLRTRYGSKKNRGARPEKFKKSGGKIIRTILQQLENAGFIEKANGKKAGRQLTKKGVEFLNKAGKQGESY